MSKIITGAVVGVLDLAKRYGATSAAWGPLLRLSRTGVLALFQQITVGQLLIVEQDGARTLCGEATLSGLPTEPKTELRVHDDAFWVRLAMFADMGFAESYMMGEVDCPDLAAFFRIFILNREQLGNATTWISSLASTISGFLRMTNGLSNAKLNISAHYDLSNEMFTAFLSDDMTYSCPIWLSKKDPKSEKETLEEAQYRKLDRFIDNARIKPHDRVLEIGTGWGSFAMRAVQRTGCHVTSLTLSKEQKDLADKNIAAAGMSERIQVMLCDYRALPVPREGPYDKIVSIEMLEAVGREYLSAYFKCVDILLKPDGGIAVFQCITMPESRYEAYTSGEDFIRKYIFPGGHLPTISQLVNSIAEGSSGKLIVEGVENIGGHYAKTLRLWREKFVRNWDHIQPALMAEHRGYLPGSAMTVVDCDIFRRKWEYYFAYCEAGFNTKTLGDVIITTGREGALELIDDIPL